MTNVYDKNKQTISLDIVADITVDGVMNSGILVPHIYIESEHNFAIHAFDAIPPTTAERERLFRITGILVRSTVPVIVQPQHLYLCVEAVMVTTDKDSLPTTQPSQHPQRIPILAITHLDVQTSTFALRVFEIKRDTTGTLRELIARPDVQSIGGEEQLLTAFVEGWRS